jgi:hypothetical protein
MIKAFVVTTTLMLMPMVSMAQAPKCGPRDAAVEHLASRYGESLQIQGIMPNGEVMEIFANITTGSWTAIGSNPNGMSCLLADGQNFTRLDLEPVPQGQDG